MGRDQPISTQNLKDITGEGCQPLSEMACYSKCSTTPFEVKELTYFVTWWRWALSLNSNKETQPADKRADTLLSK